MTHTKDYSITCFYAAKTVILLAAAGFASSMGIDATGYAAAGLLCLLASPMFFWFEPK
jgi:hypothetical protein